MPTGAASGSREWLLAYLSLFTSMGTLLCCALPSLLVLVGLGATVASVLSAAPWLVTLSGHKTWVFVIAGALLGGNLAYLYRRGRGPVADSPACSVDGSNACDTTTRVGRVILWISAGIYAVGVFVHLRHGLSGLRPRRERGPQEGGRCGVGRGQPQGRNRADPAEARQSGRS